MTTMIKQHVATDWDEICIIDDVFMTRITTKLVCEKYFGKVMIRTFEDAMEAIRYLRDFPKRRLILLDLNMPDMDGWSFLETYAPSEQESVCILSSSRFEEDMRRASQVSAVKDFIQKPITIDKLSSIRV